jgi:hypothetical protein
VSLPQKCLGQPGTPGTRFRFNVLTCPNCAWDTLGHSGQVPLGRWLSQVVPTLSQVPNATKGFENTGLFQLSPNVPTKKQESFMNSALRPARRPVGSASE